MSTLNLRNFEKPLLLFGGPYSNLDALLALKAAAGSAGITPEHIICTGDIVAYCGQPYESVELIREWGIHVLMGNCEESFAQDADDCGCGFSEGSSCDLLSVEWFQFANKQLSAEQRQWFANLPTSIIFTVANKKAQVVHGSATAINQFIFPSTSTDEFNKQFAESGADIIIAGHSGLPFTKKIDDKVWLNAGAIGMPPNDGTQQTWYSMLYPEDNTIKIDLLPLDYDHVSAKNKMIAAELNTPYAHALLSGLWPSMDVLPEEERQQQGLALQSSTTLYP